MRLYLSSRVDLNINIPTILTLAWFSRRDIAQGT